MLDAGSPSRSCLSGDFQQSTTHTYRAVARVVAKGTFAPGPGPPTRGPDPKGAVILIDMLENSRLYLKFFKIPHLYKTNPHFAMRGPLDPL